MKTSAKRQILLETAFRLFNQYGFHATGIDLIIKESETSKATLYKYFQTKDLLVLAVLHHRHQENMANIKDGIEKNLSQKEPVLSVFDVYHEWFQERTFFGCSFMKAGSEYDEGSVVNQFTYQSKMDLKQLLIHYLLSDTRTQVQAEDLAHSLMILLDGAIIDAQICHNKNAAIKAKSLASSLLKQEM